MLLLISPDDSIHMNNISLPYFISGIPVVVLLTKPDKACSTTAADLSKVYTSEEIYAILSETSQKLGVSMSAILPVKNYHQELELDGRVDILALYALRQMMRSMDNLFDDYLDRMGVL